MPVVLVQQYRVFEYASVPSTVVSATEENSLYSCMYAHIYVNDTRDTTPTRTNFEAGLLENWERANAQGGVFTWKGLDETLRESNALCSVWLLCTPVSMEQTGSDVYPRGETSRVLQGIKVPFVLNIGVNDTGDTTSKQQKRRQPSQYQEQQQTAKRVSHIVVLILVGVACRSKAYHSVDRFLPRAVLLRFGLCHEYARRLPVISRRYASVCASRRWRVVVFVRCAARACAVAVQHVLHGGAARGRETLYRRCRHHGQHGATPAKYGERGEEEEGCSDWQSRRGREGGGGSYVAGNAVD